MDDKGFREWLEKRGQASNTVATRISDARRVENHYGDLDAAYEDDRFAAILRDLAYSGTDRAAGKPNGSRIRIEGDVYNSLASYRSALSAYSRFRDAAGNGSAAVPSGLTREAVLDAIARCDGFPSSKAFIDAHEGLGAPKQYWLVHDGRRYPSKAIVRDALAHIGSDALPGGGQCKAMLEALGFVVIDWPAFERLRQTFLRRMKGFRDFRRREGDYWEVERSYKEEVTAQVRAIVASDGDSRTAGEQIFRALSVGRQGLPLGWRTLSEVEKADPLLRERFFGAVGVLARSGAETADAVEEAARAFEQLRADGIAGLRRGEVLAIAISVIGTMRPDEGSWFKVSRIEEMARTLFGRKLFRHERFARDDFDEYQQLMRALFGLMARELGWDPADLFDVQGFIWVALEEKWGGEVTAEHETDEPELDGEASYWFVGAAYGRTDDQTERFLAEGIWHIDSPTDRQREQVRSMRPGERIAIKATFVQKHDLPFDAGGRRVSVMRIKGRGTIAAASADGETLRVEWDKNFAPRDWYFYTYQPTIWQVLPNKEMNRRLIRFAFEDEPQDIGWFRANLPRWQEDAAPAAPDEEDEPAAPFAPPTNLILYGPPGTGKTFTVIAEAVRLADELPGDDPLLAESRRDELKQRYDDLVELGRIGFVTFHQNMSYEDFVEGLRPVQAEGGAGFSLQPRAGLFRRIAEEARTSAEHHVLIIDEINRANVSKVFGELITLIESDKRIGGANALRATLPYSNLPFGVPANLHIVGTMNTADRSIALLDTALRRRFDFRELMPDPDLLPEDVGGVPLRRMLRTLNERIEYLFDREHQIGHAYFIGCESRDDVDAVMRDKVIPLLQEYFYEDWSKVALVLGEADGAGRFLDRTPLKAPPGLGDDSHSDERWRWSVRSAFGDGAYAQFG